MNNLTPSEINERFKLSSAISLKVKSLIINYLERLSVLSEIKTVLPCALCFVRPPKENRPQDDELDTYQKPPLRRIMFELSELVRLERTEATERQAIAEIKNPLKTEFRRNPYDPELDKALDKLWKTGPKSRDLYVKIGKGLAAMTREDLFFLMRQTPERIEASAPLLTRGMILLLALVSAPPLTPLLLPPHASN
jgi:hypothetical protein